MSEVRRQRRKFLLGSAGLAGTWALSQLGCSTLDRMFVADSGLYDDETLIIGAGAAGLAAAYELKKRNRPYRVLEASSRFGGRVRTLNHFNSDGQFAELGAEFVDARHSDVFEICQELNIPLDEVQDPPRLEGQLFLTKGKILPRKNLIKDLQPLISKLIRYRLEVTGDRENPLQAFQVGGSPRAAELDAWSAEDLFTRISPGMNPVAVEYLRRACEVQFGVSPDRQSCLHLLMSLDPEVRGALPFRIRGGTQTLTQALHDRVAGVMPDFLVRFETKLLSVRAIGPLFECRVQGPDGKKSLFAKKVIMALPPAALRRVDGILDLPLASSRKDALKNMKMASHSRTILGFRERFWAMKSEGIASSGALLGDIRSQSCWDSSRGQAGRSGLLTFTSGGTEGLNTGAASTKQALQDLALVWKRAASFADHHEVVQNWSRVENLGGSVVVYGPGEFSRFNGVFLDSDMDGRFCFAGEHASAAFHGTLQGAIESGRRAAATIARA
jgi:monoamine oxidase